MKNLSDRFVLDRQTSLQAEQTEHARSVDVHFERNARQIKPVVIHKDTGVLNPLADALNRLKGTRP